MCYIIFNSAMSLDGRVGKKGEEIGFLNRLENYRIHKLRGSVDAIMLDVSSVISNDPEINVRGSSKEPYRVVVDDKGEIPVDSKILKGEGRKIVVVSKSAKRGNIRNLEDSGIEVITTGEYAVNLPELMDRLQRMGIDKVLVEGGGSLIRRLLNEGFINEIYITVSPVLIGEGAKLFDRLDKKVKLALDGITQYGDQVVLHYLVK